MHFVRHPIQMAYGPRAAIAFIASETVERSNAVCLYTTPTRRRTVQKLERSGFTHSATQRGFP